MADQETTTTAATDTAPPAPAPAAAPAPTGPQTFVWGVGRRKSAVARVRVAPGNGRIEVNGRTLNDYFTFERDRKAIFGPLEVTNTGGKMDVLVNATGGGPSGQTGAIIMGLGRALAKYDQTLEAPLRGAGFMTRDSRMKERKKYGQRGARRRFQFSKR
ncbi:MAG: SSU ribosomal protein S9p (S16e) [uncultured Phycisphaerae bacterium]|uniref:Small ribosomal subunit protein uS9 n=1 Tax=uncultured Phycisphaerae bacterium TaxID=904963 RepID=A0A6J4NDZ2_9BACT|nr:MAG: SSU ribosomal protein S9p (S16e) [uncultured Phycisphaerae bacterium]